MNRATTNCTTTQSGRIALPALATLYKVHVSPLASGPGIAFHTWSLSQNGDWLRVFVGAGPHFVIGSYDRQMNCRCLTSSTGRAPLIGATLFARLCRLCCRGLVAFPTETVYGLAASPFTPEAVARLQRSKDRPQDKPLTLVLAGSASVIEWLPALSPLGRRLTRRCWPGPVTLVVDEQTSRYPWIACLKVCAHVFARQAQSDYAFPIIMLSWK